MYGHYWIQKSDNHHFHPYFVIKMKSSSFSEFYLINKLNCDFLYSQILSLIISPELISIVYGIRFGNVLLLSAFSLFLTREKILWSTLWPSDLQGQQFTKTRLVLDLTSGNYGNSYLKLLHLFEVCHSCKTVKLFGVLFLSAFEKHLRM